MCEKKGALSKMFLIFWKLFYFQLSFSDVTCHLERNPEATSTFVGAFRIQLLAKNCLKTDCNCNLNVGWLWVDMQTGCSKLYFCQVIAWSQDAIYFHSYKRKTKTCIMYLKQETQEFLSGSSKIWWDPKMKRQDRRIGFWGTPGVGHL